MHNFQRGDPVQTLKEITRGLSAKRTEGIAHKNHIMRSGPCRQLFGQCVGELQSCDLRGLRQRSLLPRRQIGHHPELDGAAGIRKQRHPVRQIRLRGAIGVMQGELHGVQIDNADPDGLVFVDSHVVGQEFPSHGILPILGQHTSQAGDHHRP